MKSTFLGAIPAGLAPSLCTLEQTQCSQALTTDVTVRCRRGASGSFCNYPGKIAEKERFNANRREDNLRYFIPGNTGLPTDHGHGHEHS